MSNQQPGLIVLFGSGESLPGSGKTHERVAQALAQPRIAILETPAGFEPNSAQVAGKIGGFLQKRLQNYSPQIELIPARKKGTTCSPDNADIVRPILHANWLLLGPGSPTYAARQLRDSLAWHMAVARQRLGAALMLASSAVLAVSAQTMPVYEIYKVGADLHWQDGLNFFGDYGLTLNIIPHWNNSDGGAELDTSRCYLGQTRFDALRQMLPDDHTFLGLDEHTALVIDPATESCQVMGNGRIVILRGQQRQEYSSGDTFHPAVLGDWRLPQAGAGLPTAVWQEAQQVQREMDAATPPQPSTEVLALLAQRTQARDERNWQKADDLRDAIAGLGWQVRDTKDGATVEPLE